MKTRKDQPNKKKRQQISMAGANREFYVEAPSKAQSPETDEQARCTQSVSYLTGSVSFITVIAVKWW